MLPVTATIGGIPATVQYYGSAPGIVYGVMQVNITVPANAPSGGNVPVQITVGNSPDSIQRDGGRAIKQVTGSEGAADPFSMPANSPSGR